MNNVLFETKNGKVMDDEELNLMSLQEIEQQGIHVFDTHDEWS